MKIFRIELGFLLVLLLCSFTISTFSYEDEPIDGETIEEGLVGTWVHTDRYRNLVKKNNFADNKGGIAFGDDGTLTVRQNEGWCGTPPITYSNFKGSWEMLSDSTARLEYEYWGGTIIEEIWIEELSKNKLVYRVTNTETVMDEDFR